jgi:hypothetical protein
VRRFVSLLQVEPRPDASESIASPHDLIKSARAYIAVFASENESKAYIHCMGKRADWGANIVMVPNCKDDKFAAFF